MTELPFEDSAPKPAPNVGRIEVYKPEIGVAPKGPASEARGGASSYRSRYGSTYRPKHESANEQASTKRPPIVSRID